MRRSKDLFAPRALDEQLEQLAQNQEIGDVTVEQQLLQNLHALHAACAEQERSILEHVRLRLVAAETAQSGQENEPTQLLQTLPVSEKKPIILSTPRSRHRSRLQAFLQSSAAILVVVLLVGSLLTVLNLIRRSTNTTGGLHISTSFLKSWKIVDASHLPPQQNYLWNVSASAENNVWAVGESSDNGANVKTLIEYWNGQKWNAVKNLNPGITPTLQGVAALSPADVWVVGAMSSAQDNNASEALIEHWDGKQWKVFPSPKANSGGSSLNRVVAIAADDVWAIGNTIDAGIARGLIEHWNGKTWEIIPSPSPAAIPTYPYAMTALSANNIWVVGYLMPSDFSRRAFIEHWDGKGWSIIGVPDLKTVTSQLFSISAVSANDIWAAGTLSSSDSPNSTARPWSRPLIEHWDGKQWHESSTPNGLDNSFTSITAITSSDVWAIGSTNEQAGPPVLAVHWDGVRWSAVQMPSKSAYCQNELVDITRVPHSNSIWAVGDYVTSVCGGASASSPLQIQPLFEVYTHY